MPRSHTLLIFFSFCFTLTLLPIPTLATNATCPYDLNAATVIISPTCYANYTIPSTDCCWQVYAAYLFAATRYANLTSSAFLPAPVAAACSAAFPALLLSRRLVHPSLLSNNDSCSLGVNSLTLDASPSPCHYSTVNAVTAAVNLTTSKLLCTSPLANLTNNQTSCTQCQNAVIAAVYSLLNTTNSKQIVPCGMAATIAIWSTTNPDIPTFQSFLSCMLQILENVGTLGTDNLIPGPPPPLNPHHPPPLTRTSKSTMPVKIAVASASAAAASLAAIVCFIFAMYRRRRRSTAVTTDDGELTPAIFPGLPLPTEGLYIFTKAELKQATNGFDERLLLGEGGAGKVYLGRLPSGHHVAMKRICWEKKVGEFYREVEILAKLRHRNLTTLVGYCLGRREHVLVYEYMAGGTLAKALQAGKLSWRRRVGIAADVAEGLAYLHVFPEGSVVHRDVKPTNVLLSGDDGAGPAKLADFGVSKMMPVDATHVSTDMRGTIGYMDPDSFHVGYVSEAADVYSFGVMMLELVTGMPAVVPTASGRAESIVHLVRGAVAASTSMSEAVASMVDPRLGEGWDRASVGEMFETACQCVRSYKEERPTMAEVLLVLKRVLGDLDERTPSMEDNKEE